MIQTGTMDEIAGVPVGSGNAWVRDGWDGRMSVLLSVAGDDRIVGQGDIVIIGDRQCTLERIEAIEGRGSYHLHFRIEPIDGGSESETDSTADSRAERRPAGDGGGPRRVISALSPPLALGRGEARSLRAATADVLALLTVPVELIAESAWVREDREHWVEIDRVPCGPNTDVGWSWTTPMAADRRADGSGAPGARAEVTWSTVRWNPDEIERVSISGHWSDGTRSVHAHLDGFGGGPAGQLTVSGPPELIAAATRVVVARLGVEATSPTTGR